MLGNPPYNAVQANFHDNNQAEKYQDIDTKIEETYGKDTDVKNQNQKYDMYKRFLRWASDRIKNSGMVVFVSNNSFLNAKSNDGLRRSVFEEFDYIYTVNLKGNARTAGEDRRKQAGNVFRDTIKVGIAVSFFIKTGECQSEIHYAEIDDYLKSEEKLKWLANNSLSTLPLKQIVPNKDAIWLNQTNNDFDELIPVVSDAENSVFGSLVSGSKSHRDEWVYDFDETSLENKIKFFIAFYNNTLERYSKKSVTDINIWVDKKIKWSRDILKHIKRKNKLTYSKLNVKNTVYRPFVLKSQYFDRIITELPRKFPDVFKNSQENELICFSNPSNNSMFQVLAANKIIDTGCVGSTQCIQLYTYGDNDKHHSNITKFGLELFQKHYKSKKITGEDIFYYTYAIFNDPKYQETYKYDLQRKFPRIPLAKNFHEWVKIGKKLYDLHVGFEDVEPYPLKRIDKKTTRNSTKLNIKKPKKIEKEQEDSSESTKIIIDDKTTLEGIPKETLQYKFSSKCALEWILEFYKESKNIVTEKSCNDPKVMKKFNTYKFTDHKEHVIDLLQKVTTVSVETMNLRRELQKMPWGKQPELNLSKDSEGEKKIKNIKTKSKAIKSRKTSKKLKRTAGLQDSLDGAGQKRLF